ncbi:ATP-binding protein [Aggregatibacter actinomycetemcomitans]|uniref:AAA family ATPase n=1 Tax=Aggregatibacter actinomycetemcomitans TaxID=714 RepID=UPI00197C5E1B|nr:ATP-binding protein [Aggregatibacter actinomycetemcomitans]MBN6069459.1 ATP-binding protein [Aggregatibacter actinomycetemcomitans]MBN6085340.1 ATP-binding protein [Aggregatibacter actinomycetemcomitans]
MKFYFENLGLLDSAELNLSDLTIICGENNTGKTYATYAVYGFLRSWKVLLRNVMISEISSMEHSKEKYQINLEEVFGGKINEYLNKLGHEFQTVLNEAFAAKEDAFIDTKIRVSIEKELDVFKKPYQRRVQGGNSILATITKEADSPILELLSADIESRLGAFGLIEFVIDAIAEIVFSPYFPNPHISSAERTGAAIFRRELDMARTRMLKAINEMDSKEIRNRPWKLLQSIDTDYAWPVEDNVEFVRQLEDIDKQTSELVKEHPEILIAFDEIIGGSYKVIRDQGLVFQAKGTKNRRYTMNEASSCARALLDVGFYLRCRAKPGDLFIIDEPELNLHPKNQRAFARLIAQLVNSGIKVFMTTHSDYLIKELNTLIMLNQQTDHTKVVQEKYGYSKDELLNCNNIVLYFTEKAGKRKKQNILRQAKIYPDLGIEVTTFDDTIDLMNNIQNDLVYGGE